MVSSRGWQCDECYERLCTQWAEWAKAGAAGSESRWQGETSRRRWLWRRVLALSRDFTSDLRKEAWQVQALGERGRMAKLGTAGKSRCADHHACAKLNRKQDVLFWLLLSKQVMVSLWPVFQKKSGILISGFQWHVPGNCTYDNIF